MSSQNQAMSETAILLGDSRSASQSSGILSRKRFRFSPQILLIPVALATKLATQLPSTTLIELVRQAVCRFWNISHGGPATLPTGGSIPSELCNAPEIERYFATIIAIVAVTEGILSVFILLSTAVVAHKHSSDGWVWHHKPYFIALREEIRPLTCTHRRGHGELLDTRITVYARLARWLGLPCGDGIGNVLRSFPLCLSRQHVHCRRMRPGR